MSVDFLHCGRAPTGVRDASLDEPPTLDLPLLMLPLAADEVTLLSLPPVPFRSLLFKSLLLRSLAFALFRIAPLPGKVKNESVIE